MSMATVPWASCDVSLLLRTRTSTSSPCLLPTSYLTIPGLAPAPRRGAGIFTALHKGAREVWIVEPNPDLVHMLRDVPFFQRFTGRILDDPRVKVVNTEIRAFAGSTDQKFDLVEIGLIDSTGLSQAGGYSVEENYTYTVEAMREYLKSLDPQASLHHRLGQAQSAPKRSAASRHVVQALREEGMPNSTRTSTPSTCSCPPRRCSSRRDGFSPQRLPA